MSLSMAKADLCCFATGSLMCGSLETTNGSIAAVGCRALAIDMRGYGRSTGPEEPTAYTPFQTVGDLIGLLDALSLPNVTLVGHDFGASTSWYAAMMRPDRFTAVFGISVPYLPLGGPNLFDAMSDAGKADSFYMF